MFRTKPLALIVVSVLILFALVFWALKKPATNQPAAPSEESQSSLPSPIPSPNISPTPPSPSPSAAANPKPTKSSITIIYPASEAKWVIGQSNTIQWSKEAGISGAIYLVNAADKSVVGWITQSTGPHQTYYSWNTRDIFLSRTSPSSKTVGRGQYIIKVIFDGGSPKTEAASSPFSIIYPSEVQISTYTLTIKNYAISPSVLTVKGGSKLVFVNDDSITQKINLSGFSPMVIQPGDSFAFDTSALFPGTYNFYSDIYQSLKLTLTVQ